MRWNTVQENWERVRGEFELKWSRLDDCDLAEIDGERSRLEQTIAELYGLSRVEAAKQVQRFLQKLSMPPPGVRG